MKITYIYHSGFLIELSDCYFIFDYYKGELPKLNPQKKVYVFSSHAHKDHYNPEIFMLLERQGFGKNSDSIQAVLSYDIYEKKIPKSIQYLHVKKHQEYKLSEDITLRTLRSTDEGVAFLLFTKEGTIYHAGDLNDWVWAEESVAYNHNMTANYRKEIETLKDIPVDVAFLPLDPRQGEDYAKGLLYFIGQIKVSHVFPMHYWEKPDIIKRFKEEYLSYQELIHDTEALSQKGEKYYEI